MESVAAASRARHRLDRQREARFAKVSHARPPAAASTLPTAAVTSAFLGWKRPLAAANSSSRTNASAVVSCHVHDRSVSAWIFSTAR